MPNYETHLWLARKVGVFVGILLTIITFITGLWRFSIDIISVLIRAIIIGAIGYYSTLAGGVAPDIDLSQPSGTLSYASIPYKKLVGLSRLLIAISFLFVVVTIIEQGVDVAQAIRAIVIAGLGIIIIRAVPDFLHRVMPSHRKLTHELPFWGIMGLLGILAIQLLLREVGVDPFIEAYLPLAIGIPIFLGVVTHVSLDTVNNYVQAYAPDALQARAAQLAPWVPKTKPVIADIPQLLRIILDSRAPWTIRLFVVITFLYGIVPVDLISEAVLGPIGYIEDLGIYLSLRRTVYSGYRHEEGLLATLRRELSTVFKIYIPVFIFSVLIVVSYLIWIS